MLIKYSTFIYTTHTIAMNYIQLNYNIYIYMYISKHTNLVYNKQYTYLYWSYNM